MKRRFTLFSAILMICLCVNTPAAVVIDEVASPNGLVSFKTRSPASSDNYTVIGMPISVGLERLNEFLAGILPTEHAYLVFGYFDDGSQNTTWFPISCKVMLNKNEHISVRLTDTRCEVITS